MLENVRCVESQMGDLNKCDGNVEETEKEKPEWWMRG